MKHKIKQLIAERLIEQGKLKIFLRNLEVSGLLTEELQNKILDDLLQLDQEIQKFEAIYKSL